MLFRSMCVARRVLSLAGLLAALIPSVAAAQIINLGVGGGAGVGDRGPSGSFTHGTAFIQVKAPILPGIRGDVMAVEGMGPLGPIAVTANVVLSAPFPIITPYIIGGWGQYGFGKSTTSSGWNVGAGVKASLRIGLFLEYRRHQRIGRDLLTLGVTF